ncbi:hypothetical protein [Halorussus caseinilyticus]|uniref:Uncharacterized protein n=1 Tax=Halorussus caseinilyticus TaxID=3034025 RepID=A0ABD5WJB4_9EURY|nr:hypothetical protein [Halorussus sp. DT72]
MPPSRRHLLVAAGGSLPALAGCLSSFSGGEKVVLDYQTLLNRDGEVIPEPTVPYDRVKRVAPRRVTVSLTLDERERACVVRVKTRQTEVRQT